MSTLRRVLLLACLLLGPLSVTVLCEIYDVKRFQQNRPNHHLIKKRNRADDNDIETNMASYPSNNSHNRDNLEEFGPLTSTDSETQSNNIGAKGPNLGISGSPSLFTKRNCRLIEKHGRYKAYCSGKKLSSVPQDLPENITDLSMDRNRLTRLIPKAFSRYPLLRSLNLSSNKIAEVDGESFQGLPQLELLDLSNNRLDLMNCSRFCCLQPFRTLQNLTSLNLKLNNPRQLSAALHNCVQDLSNLESLFVTVIDNFHFGSGFRNLTKLKYLDMSGSKFLNYVSPESFENVNNLPLENLTLVSCSIFHIQKDTFRQFKRLRTLDLSENLNLGLVNATLCLNGCRNLRELYIKKLVDPALRDIVVVSEDVFEPLAEMDLTDLYMDSNSIAKIEISALEKLPASLERWYIRDNKLAEPYHFLRPLLRLKNLKVLDAKDQGSWSPRKRAISNSSRNKTINELSRKHVWHKNKAFEETVTIEVPPKLETLRFSRGNYFRFAGKYVNFVNSSLRTLYLVENNLQQFDAYISGLETVEVLDLSYNFLKVQSGFFDGFVGLRALYLYSNNLNSTFASDNTGRVLGNLHGLEKFSLENNDITKLFPDVFRNNSRLRDLYLKGNKLEELGCRIDHMTQLKLLDLSRNNLPYLNKNAMEDLGLISARHPVTILFAKNPFVCSCESLPFLRWTISLPENITLQDIHKMTCLAKNRTTHISLKRRESIVRELEIQCRSYFRLILGLSVALATSLIIVAGGLVYRFRWKLRYFYHIRVLQRFQRRHRNYPRRRYAPDNGGDDQEESFDVFVAYADEERHFVVDDMRRILEQENDLKMYIRDRDSIPGLEIATNITRAVTLSSVSILLLSRRFLQNKWCNYEFEMARIEGVVRRQNCIVYIMYEDVPATEMSNELLKAIDHGKLLERPGNPENNQNMTTFWTMLINTVKEHNI